MICEWASELPLFIAAGVQCTGGVCRCMCTFSSVELSALVWNKSSFWLKRPDKHLGLHKNKRQPFFHRQQSSYGKITLSEGCNIFYKDSYWESFFVHTTLTEVLISSPGAPEFFFMEHFPCCASQLRSHYVTSEYVIFHFYVCHLHYLLDCDAQIAFTVQNSSDSSFFHFYGLLFG